MLSRGLEEGFPQSPDHAMPLLNIVLVESPNIAYNVAPYRFYLHLQSLLPSLNLLQPHWPSCCFSNSPSIFLPWALPLTPGCSSPGYPHDTLYSGPMLQCHLPREAFLHRPVQTLPLALSSPHLLVLTPQPSARQIASCVLFCLRSSRSLRVLSLLCV